MPADDPTFPVQLGSLRLELERRADQVTARMIVVDESGSVCDIKEQRIPWERLEAASEEALARRVEARASQLEDPEYSTPWDLLRPLYAFEPIAIAQAQDADLRRGEVKSAVMEQAHAGGFEARFDRLADWPLAARTVYHLWNLELMAGGNGLEVFLSQQDPEAVIGALMALEEARCGGLATLYRRALDLAADAHLEATYDLSEAWVDANRRPARASSFGELDHWDEGGTWTLIRDELRPALDAYIDAHSGSLVAEPA